MDERMARILAAAHRGDLDDASVVLLSLATSSAMIGATTLADTARELLGDARTSRTLPPATIARLAAVGSATCAELVEIASAQGSAG